MPAFVYDHAAKSIVDGSLNLTSDTLKLMLVNQSYSPGKNDQFVSSATAAEIVATNYTGGFGGSGRQSAPRSSSLDTTNFIVREIFAANANWTALGGASNDTISAALLVKEITSDAASPLVSYFPLGCTQSGGTTSGSPTVTGLTNTLQIAVGMTVTGTGVTAGTTVAAIVSGTSVTLSANATATGTVSLTFGVPITTNGSNITLTVDATNGNITFQC